MIFGKYYTAFGIIELEEDYEKVEGINVEKNSAFLHERVHYIQDFSTIYGIIQVIYNLSQYIGNINKVRSGKSVTNVFEPLDGEDQDFIYSIVCWAKGEDFSYDGACIQCHSIYAVEEDDAYAEYYKDSYPKWQVKTKKQIILRYDDGGKYEFGGAAISESMAYLFERFFFGSQDYSHIFPYNACEMLYEYIIGEPCKEIAILISLCYAALMSLFPGATFMELLYDLKKKKDIIHSMKDVFALSTSKIESINSEIFIDELCKRIDMIFPVEIDNPIEIYEKQSMYTREWLKERYKYISKHELEFRDALIWIMEVCEKGKRISAMACLLDEYGQPLVIDKNGKLYNANDENLIHILAPFSLWGVLMERKSKCNLYQTCTAYNKKTDAECYMACWKHECKESLCLLRYYLYKMGLGDVEF